MWDAQLPALARPPRRRGSSTPATAARRSREARGRSATRARACSSGRRRAVLVRRPVARRRGRHAARAGRPRAHRAARPRVHVGRFGEPRAVARARERSCAREGMRRDRRRGPGALVHARRSATSMRFREMFLVGRPRGLCALLRGARRAGTSRGRARPRSTRPTLVIAGRRGPVDAAGDTADDRSREIPGARSWSSTRAAHLANVERPEAFNRLLEEHL